MKIILFFGSEKGFERFEYENLIVTGLKFRLCSRFDQCRGVEFHGYIVHYTASKELRRDIQWNVEELDYRVRKFNKLK